MTVDQAIEEAEAILPGQAVDVGKDPRWQAIIRLEPYIASDPEAIWAFCLRWGASDDPDLRAAVATCLLEHLLEHHFEAIFPRVEAAVAHDPRFADCFSRCWAFDPALAPENRRRFERLKARVAAS
jgi:hypothetical protein